MTVIIICASSCKMQTNNCYGNHPLHAQSAKSTIVPIKKSVYGHKNDKIYIMKGTFSDHKKSPYVCIQQDILFLCMTECPRLNMITLGDYNNKLPMWQTCSNQMI